jgi:hypothetical protein
MAKQTREAAAAATLEAPAVPEERPGAPGGDDSPPPKFGVATVADGTAHPRVIGERERAPAGLARFKIRCVSRDDQPYLYVLAADEGAARDCYLTSQKLGKGERLSVKRLPD